VSGDAGRYVCNFTYFVSLMECARLREGAGREVHALFVHVPPFDEMAESEQLVCLRRLMQLLSQHDTGGKGRKPWWRAARTQCCAPQ
jgi:pyrrolidone-carboxylate peptidase